MRSSEFDLVIRNGTVVDGLGGEPFVADVGIVGDRIAAVGLGLGTGAEDFEAEGLLVTPGFVDIHTHYDAQAIWDSRMMPSSNHGITTVVIGNCGVGFAPCKAPDRQRLVELMEGVEDIPEVVMAKGLTWEWESYPEFLDAVAARPHDVDIASYLPHAPLRVFVMGERAKAGEASTPDDRSKMAKLACEAMAAGALGFATSRSLFHKSVSGDVIPTLDADEAELEVIAQAIGEGGDGIVQVAADFAGGEGFEEEFDLLERVGFASGRPITLPIMEMHSRPGLWRDIVRRIAAANRNGAAMSAQCLPRPLGVLLGLNLTAHPFFLKPSYQEIEHVPLPDRIALMRDPERRRRIISESSVKHHQPIAMTVSLFDEMYEAVDPLNYEPDPSESIGARAAAMGDTPENLAYDILLRHGDKAAIFLPFANYASGNLDSALEMFRHPDVVLGLGDGGAHYGIICDASYSTFLLSYWTRDRQRGERLAVPEVVRALTHDTASVVGLLDRGVIAPGYKADLNVIDYCRLKLGQPVISFDLPENGRRLSQNAEGYAATIVSGNITYRDGRQTGALPGRLVRGRQEAPQDALS